MAKTTKTKIGWNESVLLGIQTSWFRHREQLPELDNLAIPRIPSAPYDVSLEVCGFCSTSERAYGAHVHMQTIVTNGQTSTAFVASKASLTTKVFITTVKRLVARRGKTHNMYFDNGMNLARATNGLKKIDQLHIKHFWTHWQREYFNRFQERTKWSATKNMLVIVQDDNTPPPRWRIG